MASLPFKTNKVKPSNTLHGPGIESETLATWSLYSTNYTSSILYGKFRKTEKKPSNTLPELMSKYIAHDTPSRVTLTYDLKGQVHTTSSSIAGKTINRSKGNHF
uniref:SFRICE_035741 n=1 Tax=Spodoptera frugiperda TaxID=7108 RepID=A0A2H1X275_SPOFR